MSRPLPSSRTPLPGKLGAGTSPTFHVFGCWAFVHVPAAQRSKWRQTLLYVRSWATTEPRGFPSNPLANAPVHGHCLRRGVLRRTLNALSSKTTSRIPEHQLWQLGARQPYPLIHPNITHIIIHPVHLNIAHLFINDASSNAPPADEASTSSRPKRITCTSVHDDGRPALFGKFVWTAKVPRRACPRGKG